ncbi:MAG: ATP-dependent DNA helicase [Alphaproteobacteria bacterium]|nr:ATP-dependent DNA helicase [Alphaproteobacteria bacterium]
MDSLSSLIALVPAPPGAAIARADGATERIELRDARALFETGNVLVAHGGFVAGRLGTRAETMLFDVLEVFAFVRPGLPFVPSALGLARALGLAVPQSPEQSARTLHAIARALLDEVAARPQDVREALAPLVGTLDRAGWRWAPLLKSIVGEVPHGSPIAGLEAWRGLAQWEDEAPVGDPGTQSVEPAEARARLSRMVGVARPQQAAYSDAATYAFGPREQAGAPRVALVEAGTGTGKTLGYLAPASVWAEKNGPGLWISTYTRNLQRQIVQEISHLWPDPVERADKAVVRKGANHALVIAQASADWLSTDETTDTPNERRLRYVFDEGHHLFDAADSGFSASLSGREMTELRRWIRGPEGRAHTRMRGLEERLKDLIADDDAAQKALDEAVQASSALAGEGWTTRLGSGPRGPGEVFLAAAYQHVRARSRDENFYSLEADTQPMSPEMLQAVSGLSHDLKRIADPLKELARLLRKKMNDKTTELEPYTKARLDAAARGLDRRAKAVLPAWIQMLETLVNGEIAEEFVDWFELAREDGRDADIGLERHWIDPTKPLSTAVLETAHGALITSATLRDNGGDHDDHWASAEVRTGASHLPQPARRAHFGSPFLYEDQSRVFVVTDIARRDPDALAMAYRELFLASGGGALGLFTAVRALRDTGTRIAEPLASAGLTLYAQHMDRLDTGALVDLFRAEENACLLGTDALRDGVDVPGRSLRLVVFDKVPWPKPTILHKARRAKFDKGYDDLITRFRLKQAFGRLIRGPQDRGCFVILEGATPSRLLTAFPEKSPVKRCGLAEAIGDIRAFLGEPAVTHAPTPLITG